ncbi:hypothetical protein EI77_03408 [Prosthecobacter fusiformis]|uniref:Uncharacterized protein n=1 Tax=Prosthecobacter fusiformis TaxID=48464 RepID=A0A4R7RR69_9BACT|nr:hypothetical protein [Prosthecobacter fusiformis]TDU67206.1 hypothetical protein EI77_03408 [Prosthecobacter fusiformis]
MSAHSIEFSCQTCQVQGSTFLLITGADYLTDSGEKLRVIAEVGHCADCQKFVPIENLSLARAQARLDEVIRNVEQDTQTLVKLRATWAYKLGWRKAEEASVEKNRDYFKNLIPESHFYVDLCKRRQGQARCLNCGSQSVTGSFDLPSYTDLMREGSLPMTAKHPACGGDLVARLSRLRIAHRAPEPRLYNLDGEELVSVSRMFRESWE